MKTNYILFAILVLVSSSCNNTDKPKENPNIKKTFRENGTLLASYTMKNGKYDGVAYNYYENGNVNFEFFYVNGLKEGIVKRYYQDGKLYSQTPYIHDTVDGIRKIYYESGIVSSEIPYKKGNLEPGLKEYEVDGKLKTKDISITVTPSKNSKNKFQLTTSKKSDIAKFFRLSGKDPFYTKTEIPSNKGVAILSVNKTTNEPLLIEAQITTNFGSIQIIRTYIDAKNLKK